MTQIRDSVHYLVPVVHRERISEWLCKGFTIYYLSHTALVPQLAKSYGNSTILTATLIQLSEGAQLIAFTPLPPHNPSL
jgi:hypothetical protein